MHRPDADKLHRQLGDLGEIFRDRRWRYHTMIGMTLGMAGEPSVMGPLPGQSGAKVIA